MISSERSSSRVRLLTALGCTALVAWAVWWIVCFRAGELPFARALWFHYPALGADFWSQSDYAARRFHLGIDPYANERHLFHYPPIVIRLFLWTPYFTVPTALKIWCSVLALLMSGATFMASRARRELDVETVPLPLLMALVLLSYPAIFTLERSNFDLVTLAALLAAVPLLRRGDTASEIAAGCLLSIGPWVKIYPGLIGLGLVVLRRPRAVLGFVLGGAAIGLSMPRETLRSFEVLAHAIRLYQTVEKGVAYYPWSHSLTMAWANIVDLSASTAVGPLLARLRTQAFAGIVLGPALVATSWRVFRCSNAAKLTYPYLLFILSLASFVPEIANDYSLAFLPLATACVLSARDGRIVLGLMVLALVVWQPVALSFDFAGFGLTLLAIKVGWLYAVAGSLILRAREQSDGVVPASGTGSVAPGGLEPRAAPGA